MHNNEILISNLKNKDEAALSQLYDAYAPAIYGVIFRMCKDEQHAQNILQDTFLTIWDKSHQYNPEKGKFYTWAYRIAKNKTLNFLRSKKKLIQTEDLSVYKDETETLKDEVDTFQLKGYLNKLEPHHKKALELVFFNGLTHREAHKEMDVPLGTFKSYIKQALKKLKLSYDKAIVWLLILIEVIR
ncbi:RNA polymerase, sigma-24 subunit, RpoE [Hyunsoonleella jejuensis]|uniref:RNA polymerase, sigma-24 subunit, RpoE n=1 Tax=Hyunsoonleella jejuensis TaxID=419940 RepID=A0A1H9FUE1_9FLAO|nr:RNA polymerase sigma factor [Hyunsoonleella jejuensis]SEQ41515.1 RNA polymerase, sigma-24 subunit, RpoE [Hyunsoonleella jejuensis]